MSVTIHHKNILTVGILSILLCSKINRYFVIFTDSEYLKNRVLQLEDGYDKQEPVGTWQFDTCDTLAATDSQAYPTLCSGMYHSNI